MAFRRVAGAYIRSDDQERVYQRSAAQDDLQALLDYIDDSPLRDMPQYWAIYEIVPDEAVLPPSAVKGAPGSAVVRTGTPKTLARWQSNRRMQEVATAWRPDLEPEEAVAQWYAHGGTMQPLRWSDAEVDALAGSLQAERQQRQEGQRGQYVLMVSEGRQRTRRRSERGAPGSEQRERYNARRREQYRRRRSRNQ